MAEAYIAVDESCSDKTVRVNGGTDTDAAAEAVGGTARDENTYTAR